MKNFFKLSTPWALMLLIVASSCAPKYGRHFSPAEFTTQKADKQDKVAQAEATTLLPDNAERQFASGATESFSDAVPASVENQLVAAEAVQADADSKLPEISRREQRQIVKELRSKLKNMDGAERAAFREKAISQLNQNRASSPPPPPGSGASNINPVLLVIVTILIPPLGVFLYEGDINTKFWISLLLTLLFYIPGLIYSLLVIFGQV